MADKGGVLVVAETIDGALAPISAELVGAGTRLAEGLGTTVAAVLLGSGLDAAAASLASLGPARVLVADDERLADLQPDPIVATLTAVVGAEEPAAVLPRQGQVEEGHVGGAHVGIPRGARCDARADGGHVVSGPGITSRRPLLKRAILARAIPGRCRAGPAGATAARDRRRATVRPRASPPAPGSPRAPGYGASPAPRRRPGSRRRRSRPRGRPRAEGAPALRAEPAPRRPRPRP